MNQKKIAKIIIERRKSKNMTQQKLAEVLGVTNRTIINWEKGKCLPDYSLLIPLCSELDISVSELLTGEKEEQTNATVEMIIKYLDRNRNENLNEYTKVGKILLFGGILLAIVSVQIPPFIHYTGIFLNSLVNVYPIIGFLLSFLGYRYINKKYTFKKRILLNTLFAFCFISFLLGCDILSIKRNYEVSRYHMNFITNALDDGIVYVETPFYDTYSCYDWQFHIIPPSMKRYDENDADYLRDLYCEKKDDSFEEGK